MSEITPAQTKAAQEQLEAHLREIINWHFSPETGSPFWLDWAKKNFDPRGKVNNYEDIVAKAHEAAERDRARMLAELRREVGRLVLQTTAAVTGKVLTADDHRRLAEETARQLSA